MQLDPQLRSTKVPLSGEAYFRKSTFRFSTTKKSRKKKFLTSKVSVFLKIFACVEVFTYRCVAFCQKGALLRRGTQGWGRPLGCSLRPLLLRPDLARLAQVGGGQQLQLAHNVQCCLQTRFLKKIKRQSKLPNLGFKDYRYRYSN